MLSIRRSEERGLVDVGWLKSRHTFSFGEYVDPSFMGFRSLRVINEDRVLPGMGFGTHPHRDMEIISYVLDGALEHRDSLGTGSIIQAGDVQRMTAGTGVTHSEFNHSKSLPVHFLQIWILPEKKGLTPSYEQKNFTREEREGHLHLIASREGRQGSLVVHQDLNLYSALLNKGQKLSQPVAEGRFVWVQVARGTLILNGETLQSGDGAALSSEKMLTMEALESCEFLVFDLA